VTGNEKRTRFELLVIPHLDAAYNLARWLLRSDQDARDVTQEAMLRAYQFFDSFRGGEVRPWLMAIVRNRCYSWFERHRPGDLELSFDEQMDSGAFVDPAGAGQTGGPEADYMRKARAQAVRDAVARLPLEFREVVIYREFEDLSYKEIARIIDVPPGTVMSRLARARQRLHVLLEADYRENWDAL